MKLERINKRMNKRMNKRCELVRILGANADAINDSRKPKSQGSREERNSLRLVLFYGKE